MAPARDIDGGVVRRIFVPPRHADPVLAATTDSAWTMGWTLIGLSVVNSAGTLLLPPSSLRALVILFAGLAMGAATLLLVRMGLVRAACWVLVVLFWVYAVGAEWTAGGVQAPSIAVQILFVVAAGVVLGWRAGIVATLAAAVTVFALAWAEVAGVLPVPHVLHTPWSRAWAMTGYLMAALVIVVVNMVNLERSRDRALSEVTQRRETEAFLSEVVASPPGVFYAIDPDGRFLRWNRQMETLTGLSNAEITLAHFSQAIETSDKEAVIAAVAGAFERGSAEVEAKIQTMEGPRDFILTGRRVDAEAGAFVVGFGVDVTARHEAQQALVTLNKELDQRVELRTAQLEEALHSLESFSYSVSHDLRAPLRAINGYASILESDYPDALGEEGAQLCERIRANTLHMGGLIDDLMSFSRLERHQMHSEPVDHGPAGRVGGRRPQHGRGRRSGAVGGRASAARLGGRGDAASGVGQPAGQCGEVLGHRGRSAGDGGVRRRVRRAGVLRERQRRGLRLPVRRQGLRRLRAPARQRLRRHGHRPRHRQADRGGARRTGVVRIAAGGGVDVLLLAARGRLDGGSDCVRGRVRTVRGDVDAADLGLTLPHEHLVSSLTAKLTPPEGDPGRRLRDLPLTAELVDAVRRAPFSSRDNLVMDEALATAELAAFVGAGGRTVVDQTPPDLGRDLPALRRIAAATGLHVVAACGVYLPLLQVGMARRDPDELAEAWAAELTADPEAGGTPCGVIGEIAVSRRLRAAERVALRAAAGAHAATGAPVSIHAVAPDDALAALDLLAAEGVPARRIAVCHADALVDRGYQRELAARGVYVEFDFFGWHAVSGADANGEGDRERVAAAAALITGAAGDRVLLSQDVVTRIQCTRFGGGGYAHLLTGLAGWFEQDGVGPEELRRVMTQNPAAWLSWS